MQELSKKYNENGCVGNTQLVPAWF